MGYGRLIDIAGQGCDRYALMLPRHNVAMCVLIQDARENLLIKDCPASCGFIFDTLPILNALEDRDCFPS